jgi:hypothetical protein
MSTSHLDRPGDIGVVHFLNQTHADPDDVVNDPDLLLQTKRELLADWASDRRAVLDHPALRRLDTGALVNIDAVLDALKRLDELEVQEAWAALSRPPGKTRAKPHRMTWAFWKDDDDDDPPPCPAAAVPWKPRPLLDATADLMVA